MINTTDKIDLDRLKEAIRIEDLAEQLGLKIRGRQAQCYNGQEHKNGDQHFSLGLDVKRNRYKCFSCNEQGSVIDLYKQVKGIDLNQAIKELASMAGLAPATPQTSYKTSTTPYKAYSKPQTAPDEPAGAYKEVYEELIYICAGLDKESHDYLTGSSRGLTEDTLNHFLLCSVDDYQSIDKHLKDNFSKEELQGAGVIGDKGNLLFYKHKIIIPFLNEGRAVFLQGRRLDEEQPKYLHLKRPVPLFNLDTLTGLEQGDKVYISEGVFDAMMLEQAGYRAVAILGVNNFKAEFIDLFKGLDVVLCLDNDEAGKRATDDLAKMFLLKGQAVKTKQLPDNIKDISDYFLNYEKLQS